MVWLIALGLAAFVYSIISYYKLIIVTKNLSDFGVTKEIPSSLEGKKILFFSDMQFELPFNKYNHKMAKKVVDVINNQDVDLVIFGGDFSSSGFYKEPHTFDYLKKIRHPQIAVLGNHDHRRHFLKEIYKNYPSIGTLLVNQNFEWNGISFYGVDDRKAKSVLNYKFGDNSINIVLSHRPDYIMDASTNFDIVLSGHTHGGQITAFGLWAPDAHNKYGQMLVSGLKYIKGKGSIFVSKGVGGNVFGLPIRFFAPPDILIIECKKDSN